VRFFVDGKQVDIDRKGAADVFTGSWSTSLVPQGRHQLRATAIDAGGRTLSTVRHVRVCR
jgi:hypothetical protein